MKRPNYGNWVPSQIFKIAILVMLLLSLVFLASLYFLDNIILPIFSLLLFALTFAFTVYMWVCYRCFSFEHGGLMGKIHEHILKYLHWSGEGTVIDIGCGSGALTIRCAKCYPKANVIGVDFWGKNWDYAKEQCEENAIIEGVANRTAFEKEDAAHLSFPDRSFDAAISNFVFHEVRSSKDKRDVVREALRVVKKGGAFAFQDMFGQEKLYGDIDEFIKILKEEGISQIHYIGNIDKEEFIPAFLRAPWMIYKVGLIYGIK